MKIKIIYLITFILVPILVMSQSGSPLLKIVVDENGEKTNEIYVGKPNKGECVILQRTSELLNVSRGDDIHLSYQDNELDFNVIEICEQDKKFLDFEG